MRSDSTTRIRGVSTAVGLVVGGCAFFSTLLDYGTDLTRTAVAAGYYSHFFDAQARGILDGRLSLPPETLGIEAFEHDGNYYTYFPPFPALLRLPVLLTTHEFDGQLTLLSMATAWVVLATICARLIWLLIDTLRPGRPITRSTGVLVAAFLAAATGGTVVTFDASLPWVYHEVYVWAVTAVVGAMYWMVRMALDPSPGNIRWLAVFAIIAVGTRSTAGWAVCLVIMAMALWMWRRPTTPAHQRRWMLVVAAGAVPLLAGIALNLVKFDNVYMFPLQDQVWTQVSEQRREALAANGGSLTGLQFFTTSFMAYLRPDGIRFVDYYPWITLPAQAPPAYGGAFYDQAYRTGSLTSFMPLFMVLLLVTVVTVFWPRVRWELRILRFPVIAGILVTGGVMAYGYYANRYTSDFVPALIFGGAVGTALITGWSPRRALPLPRSLARAGRPEVVHGAVLAAYAGLALFSVAAQLAIGHSNAAYVHRGDPLQRYVENQLQASPRAQAGLVTFVDGLPDGGRTDQLAVRGDCEALYLHTGDTYEPWVPVEERGQVLAINGSSLRPGGVVWLVVSGKDRQFVEVEVNGFRQLRFTVRAGGATSRGDWIDIPTDGARVGIRNQTDFGYFELASSPGGVVGYLPSVYFDEDWNSLPAEVKRKDRALRKLGLRVEEVGSLRLPLCDAVAANARSFGK